MKEVFFIVFNGKTNKILTEKETALANLLKIKKGE